MTQPKLATPVVLRNCAVEVRRGSKIEKCGHTLKSAKCSKRDEHLLPFVTGFCNSGWHEGHKVNKPTCRFWLTCPCECHTTISLMAEMTDTPRNLIDNSTYAPNRDAFVRVSLTESVEAAIIAKRGAVKVESPAPGIVPAQLAREFDPTPTGRAGRGQLESWVQKVTDIWAVEGGKPCTPGYVSSEIARMQGISPPSTGAVDAVFKRWVGYGFAVIGTKPTRFERYTEDGVKFGLDVMKAKSKR